MFRDVRMRLSVLLGTAVRNIVSHIHFYLILQDSQPEIAECIGYISLVRSAWIGVVRVRMWKRSHVRSWIWQ